MQSASRRGFASIARTSLLRKSTFAITGRCLSRPLVAPATSRPCLVSRLHTSPIYRASAAAVAEASIQDEHHDPDLITQFADLGTQGLIDQSIVDVLTMHLKLETMTAVQSQTIKAAVQGTDILGVARTGTGKTLAFLLPVIQRILETSPELKDKQKRPKIDIQSIIISPTRELAEQISKSARRIVGNTGIEVGLAVGGIGRGPSLRNMERYGCHVLVATPGRLKDLLSDRQTLIKAPRLNTFVLDEADRLLDEGFGPDIEEIYTHLPGKLEVDRQTLMFSATMEPAVMKMVKKLMKPDFKTVRTVREGEAQTHANVPQRVIVTHGLENQMPALFELIKRESAATENFKAIVFYGTAATATLAARTWEKSSLCDKTSIAGFPMHSRMTQNARTKTSERFRSARRAIMFASDVASRGMDFPGVTHVIQVGQPKDRDTYIHRIGRTGRAGKEGQGWLIVSPLDGGDTLRMLKGLPIVEDTSIETAKVDMGKSLAIPQAAADILTDTIQAVKSVAFNVKSEAFRSLFGLSNSTNKRRIVVMLNRLSRQGWGLDPPPAITRLLANKLGFGSDPDIYVGNDERFEAPAVSERGQNGGSGRGGFAGRSSGRGSFDGPVRGYESRDGEAGRTPRDRSDRDANSRGGYGERRSFDRSSRGSSRRDGDRRPSSRYDRDSDDRRSFSESRGPPRARTSY